MKNKISHKKVAFATALVASMAYACSAFAQGAGDNQEQKLQLMIAAVDARDKGDLEISKQNLEGLLKISPDDKRVQKLLSEVNAEIEAAAKAKAEAEAAAKAELEAKAKAEAEAKAAAEKAIADEKAAAEAKAAEEAKVAEAKAAEEKEAAEKAAAEQAKLDEVQTAMEAEQRKQALTIGSVFEMIEEAYDQADNGRFDDALVILAEGEAKLPEVANANGARQQIKEARADIAKSRAKLALKNRKVNEAKKFAQEYAKYTDSVKDGEKFIAEVEEISQNPYARSLEEISPDYNARQKRVSLLLADARAQYLFGDFQGAASTYRTVVAIDADNMEAKAYLTLIAKKLYNSVGKLTYQQSRAELLDEVAKAWQRPAMFTVTSNNSDQGEQVVPLKAKLSQIIIPEVSFPEPGVSLTDALNTLSELSIINDKDAKGAKGVNIVARDVSDTKNVSLTVRNLTLEQILSFVTKQVNCQYDIEDGAVVVRKAANAEAYETFDFPIPAAAVTRMVGLQGSSAGGDSSDPFASGDDSGEGGDDTEKTGQKIRIFLEKAGVEFGPGASLAYDGTKLWVTNSTRNVEKVRRILARYNETLQVEIEARFMEVNQGALKEIGFNWNVYNQDGNKLFGTANTSIKDMNTTSMNNRTLATAFSPAQETQNINISYRDGSSQPPISQIPPSLPSTINLATDASNTVSTVLGIINGYNIDLVVNAIEQNTGSDLLCSPKVTVRSGDKATITVAQEMLYPTMWGDTQAQVSESSGSISTNLPGYSSGGGASVAITPGTPQEFTKRDVGVVMEVTPTVEEDGAISLDMPSIKVTEFEGFMQYGGVAVALAGDTTVTVPSGFVMPVFSVREVQTRVTVFDGATVVLGGLTREDVRTIEDSVPILGDIPLVGRLFQSKGKTSEKKNLIIFVTANKISPGGSLVREQIGNIPAGSIFSNPNIIAPSGSVNRTLVTESAAEEK